MKSRGSVNKDKYQEKKGELISNLCIRKADSYPIDFFNSYYLSVLAKR